jgi:hypothetical protein
MLWMLLSRWLKKKLKNPWNNPHALFCSEFVAQVLRWSYYPGTEYWTPAEMTPRDLYIFILQQEAKEAHSAA